MTALSPVAQAIFNASKNVKSAFSPRQRHKQRLSAAFRELVAQCAVNRPIHPDSLGTENIIEVDDVMAIAKELEEEF